MKRSGYLVFPMSFTSTNYGCTCTTNRTAHGEWALDFVGLKEITRAYVGFDVNETSKTKDVGAFIFIGF